MNTSAYIDAPNAQATHDELALKHHRDRMRMDPRLSARLVTSRGSVPTKTVVVWAVTLAAAFIGLGATLQ